MFVYVAREATAVGKGVEVGEERFVQTQNVVPIRCVGRKRQHHLNVAVADDCGIHVHSHKIVVLRLSSAYELVDDTLAVIIKRIVTKKQTNRSGDVRDVYPCIAFTGQVHPPVLHAEQFDKISPETNEF